MTRAVLWLFCAILGWADLASVKSEPNAGRRSMLALANADATLTKAQEAYKEGDTAKAEAALAEIRESLELCVLSLEQTHERPRNNKFYKHAELTLRPLIRRIKGFEELVAFEDRSLVEPLEKRAEEIHDRLIDDIMSKRK